MTPLESALVPLWCRARCALEYPALGVGGEDARIISRLRADFSAARRSDCALYALRERLALDAADAYLKERPGAALVDLGCGLDTALRRIGGAANARYYIDLAETLELRRELIPAGPGETYAAADLRLGLPDLKIDAEGGAFFLLSGLLGHMEPGAAKALLVEIAGRFPNCALAFDGVSGSAFSLFGRGAQLVSPLPAKRELRRMFRRCERVSRLPEGFSALPPARRAKLGLLLGTGLLGFYSARA